MISIGSGPTLPPLFRENSMALEKKGGAGPEPFNNILMYFL